MVHPPTQLLRLLDLDQILFLSNLPSFLVLSSLEKVVIYGSEKKGNLDKTVKRTIFSESPGELGFGCFEFGGEILMGTDH